MSLRAVPPASAALTKGRAELRVSADMPLPLDTVTQSLAIVATRGSGKSYLAKKMVEEFLKNDLPVVVIDLMGVFYGLRSSNDGKRDGFPIPIFGGDHGDVPLVAEMGKTLAAWVCGGETRPRSCVIDVSLMRKSDQYLVVTEFAEELYFRNSRPLHVVLDEADFFLPQRMKKNVERMFDAFDGMVRRGRVKGFGITMITQRPAVLNKDVLTQVSALVMLRLGAPQDHKAIEGWIERHTSRDDMEAVLSSLATLPIGVAWVCSPGWLRQLRKIRVSRQATWDSSATPKLGETPAAPERRAVVHYETLRAELSAAAEALTGDKEGA